MFCWPSEDLLVPYTPDVQLCFAARRREKETYYCFADIVPGEEYLLGALPLSNANAPGWLGPDKRGVGPGDAGADTSPDKNNTDRQTAGAVKIDPTRDQKLARYRRKRRTRSFEKRCFYAVRRKFANSRPRVAGRFVKIS